MTTFDQTMPASAAKPGILDRERIIATTGFNRWLVPPAALCIHLCIGMAYGFSVFWLPLSRPLGITASKTCPDMSLVKELFTTTCDWRVASMGWMYTLFFVILGVSAAIWEAGWSAPVREKPASLPPVAGPAGSCLAPSASTFTSYGSCGLAQVSSVASVWASVTSPRCRRW